MAKMNEWFILESDLIVSEEVNETKRRDRGCGNLTASPNVSAKNVIES